MIRVPQGTLRYWRHLGCGPMSFKMGAEVGRHAIRRARDAPRLADARPPVAGETTTSRRTRSVRRRGRMATIGPRRADGTYRVRYRDRAGKEHARHFKRKVDAQRWLDEVTTSIITGATSRRAPASSPSASMPRGGGRSRSTATAPPSTSRRRCAGGSTPSSATSRSSRSSRPTSRRSSNVSSRPSRPRPSSSPTATSRRSSRPPSETAASRSRPVTASACRRTSRRRSRRWPPARSTPSLRRSPSATRPWSCSRPGPVCVRARSSGSPSTASTSCGAPSSSTGR
jgi:hypothetical protein